MARRARCSGTRRSSSTCAATRAGCCRRRWPSCGCSRPRASSSARGPARAGASFVADGTAVGKLRRGRPDQRRHRQRRRGRRRGAASRRRRDRRRRAQLRQGHGAGDRAAGGRRRAQADGGRGSCSPGGRAVSRAAAIVPDIAVPAGRARTDRVPARARFGRWRALDAAPAAGRRSSARCRLRARVVVGEPFFEPGPAAHAGPGRRSTPAPGDLVAVVVDGPRAGRCVEQVSGPPPTCPAAVLHGLAVEAGVAAPWPEDVVVEVARCPPGAGRGRLDLRDARDAHDRSRPTRAITTTRSRSTATACSCTSPTWRPSCPGGCGLDREAARRATSVYLPGRVDPMLPDELSSDRCSLRPGADRLAVTVALGPGRDGPAHRTRSCAATTR